MKATFSLPLLFTFACICFAEPRPSQSKIIVLDNDRLMEGIVTKTEEGMEIQQTIGGTLTLPPRRIVAVVENREAAFDIVSRRKNLNDAADRLELAKWCEFNGLLDLAKRETKAALQLRPSFDAAANYLKTLEVIPTTPTAPVTLHQPTATPAIRTVKETKQLDYNTATFGHFASQVHPILLNMCASCHSQGNVNQFPLVKLTGRENVSRNLQQALAQIDEKNPEQSAILLKAITPHGNAKDAPIRSRNHPAYQVLESWVLIARAPEGTVTPLPKLVKLGSPIPEPLPLPTTLAPAANTTTNTMAPKNDQFGSLKKEDPTAPKVTDPFDPATFNNAPIKKN